MRRAGAWAPVWMVMLLAGACGDAPIEIVALGAAHQPVCCGTCCYIDDTCLLLGAFHLENDCWVCDPEGNGGPFAWSDAAGTCDDHNDCTDDDQCDAGVCQGTPRQVGDDCDDGDPCSEGDTCMTGPFCAGRPVDCSAVDDGCNAGACDTTSGACVAAPLPAGLGCVDWGPGCDGFYCDGEGACVDPEGARCAVEGRCVVASAPHPEAPCLLCEPRTTTSGWSPRPAETPCGPAQRCDDTLNGPVLVAATRCDAAGGCVRGEVSDCGAFAHCAEDGSGCATTCTGDDDCITDARCEGSICLGQRALGEACTSAGQCVSLACVDGFCCDQRCTEACVACVASHTGATTGACAPVIAGIDPDDDCAVAPPPSCGTTGVCDGFGACEHYGTDTECDTASCDSYNQLVAWRCDGVGACVEAAAQSCHPGVCRQQSCDFVCDGDNDCATTAYCDRPDLEIPGQCSAANRPPVANLTGPAEGFGNLPVTLDASGSFDPDGDPLTFRYAQLLGPSVEMAPAAAEIKILLPPVMAMEDVIIEVIANDGELDSEPAVHVITIHLVEAGCPCNGAPGAPTLASAAVFSLALWRRRSKGEFEGKNAPPAAAPPPTAHRRAGAHSVENES